MDNLDAIKEQQVAGVQRLSVRKVPKENKGTIMLLLSLLRLLLLMYICVVYLYIYT
jgi:hypothetical protein